MDRATASASPRSTTTNEKLLRQFARLMREQHGARLYLFGSRARGTQRAYSDYDIVAVAASFVGREKSRRVSDRYRLWDLAGGWAEGLDLHPYTPDEYRRAVRGLGFIGSAKRRGEIVRVCLTPKRARTTADGIGQSAAGQVSGDDASEHR